MSAAFFSADSNALRKSLCDESLLYCPLPLSFLFSLVSFSFGFWKLTQVYVASACHENRGIVQWRGQQRLNIRGSEICRDGRKHLHSVYHFKQLLTSGQWMLPDILYVMITCWHGRICSPVWKQDIKIFSLAITSYLHLLTNVIFTIRIS